MIYSLSQSSYKGPFFSTALRRSSRLSGGASAKAIVFSFSQAPWLGGWRWSNGFNERIKPPTTYSDYIFADAMAMSPNAAYVALGAASSPYLYVYDFNVLDGFGQRRTVTADKPPARLSALRFSNANNTIAAVSFQSPYILVYGWSSSGFSSKFANPSTLPSGGQFDIHFDPNDNYIVFGDTNTPFIHAYAWSNSTGFGAKLAAPLTLPLEDVEQVRFSPSGQDIALGSYQLPGSVLTYAWNNGFGTKYSQPASNPTASVMGLDWSINGNAIFAGGSLDLQAWPFTSGFGYGTRYALPAGFTDQIQELGVINDGSEEGSVIVSTYGVPHHFGFAFTLGGGFGTRYPNPLELVDTENVNEDLAVHKT